jgi:hypothetical protein
VGAALLAAAAVSIAPVLLPAASAHIRASAFFFLLPVASAAHVAFLAPQIKSNYEQQQ